MTTRTRHQTETHATEPDAAASTAAHASDATEKNPDMAGATAAAFGAFAQHSIQQGIQSLHLDPQLLELGQQVVAGANSIVAPVRRAYKSNPMLVATGVASLAVGSVLLGLALIRDNNISFRGLKSSLNSKLAN